MDDRPTDGTRDQNSADVVELTGRLLCADLTEASTVRQHLPEHIALTRAEPGCFRFEVEPTEDPLVWTVVEQFVDRAAFDAHQARVRTSRWLEATAGIARDYVISTRDSLDEVSAVTPSPMLRRLRVSDAPAVHAAFGSADDMARQGDVTTLAEAERYVARLLAEDSPHEPWAIAEGEELIGLIAVTVDEENLSGWFWYWVTHRARGRGLTARAAATVAQWALTERGLERLELGHRVNNPASGAVARAAGFVKEGTERGKFLIDGQRFDVDTYGRLRTDPAPAFDSLPLRTGE